MRFILQIYKKSHTSQTVATKKAHALSSAASKTASWAVTTLASEATLSTLSEAFRPAPLASSAPLAAATPTAAEEVHAIADVQHGIGGQRVHLAVGPAIGVHLPREVGLLVQDVVPL